MARDQRIFLFATLLTALSQAAFAQAGVAGAALNDTQPLGRRLFTKSCGVCHAKPVILGHLYGPALSKETLGGQKDALVEVISDGTPRMPGFKYSYDPRQIAAIVAYLLTIAPPSQPAPAPGK